MVKGIQAHEVYVYNKHFALNDQETNRSGVGIWANEQAIRENYLRAFEIPIIEGGAINTMTTFSRLGASMVSTDFNLMTLWARGECGLTGFHVTDTWRAISSYTPLYAVLMSGINLPDGTASASDLQPFEGSNGNYGALAQDMRESVHLIMYTTVQSNLMNGITPGAEFVPVTPWWSVLLLSLIWVSAGILVLSSVWTVVTAVKYKKRR